MEEAKQVNYDDLNCVEEIRQSNLLKCCGMQLDLKLGKLCYQALESGQDFDKIISSGKYQFH